MNYFNIETAWLNHLGKYNIDMAVLPIDQLAALKRAFISGISVLFEYMDNEVANMSEADQDNVILDLQTELTLFKNAELKDMLS